MLGPGATVKDPIGVIESTYSREAGTEAEWLARVASEIRSNLTDSSEPLIAWTYHVRPDGYIEPQSVFAEPAGVAEQFLSFAAPDDAQAAMTQLHLTAGLDSATHFLRPFSKSSAMFAYFDRVLLSRGYPEMLALNSVDAARRGCMVALPTKSVAGLHRSTSAQWARISVHVAAGLRLFRKLSVPQPTTDDPATADAILTPGGRVEHANAPATSRTARDSLRAGALAMGRARGPLRRRDPFEAVEVWRGMVAGVWSLVDHFDTDGRRYLVAHRNEPTTLDPRALTERERQIVAYADLGQSNKLIAYQLGLSTSTVAVLLGRARAKLSLLSGDQRLPSDG
jgi:hypothetical protein